MKYLQFKDDLNRAKELFTLNERVFGVIGAWPLQSTYIKFGIWTVYLVIHMCMLFADLFDVFGNLELMVLNLCESTFDIMIILKLMVMRFSRRLFDLMRRIIDDVDAKYFDNNEEKKIYLDYNVIAKIFFKLWLTMGIISAVAYNLKPMEFRLKAVLLNVSQPFVLSHRTRLFFEVNDSTRFWLVWIYESPMACMAIFHTATIGYLFSLVLHICGQLAVLSYKIKNLNLDPRASDDSLKSIVRNLVIRHRDILETARGVNQVFSLLLLEELFISTLLIGLTCYNVLENVDLEETGMFVSFLLYGCTMLLLIYGYCVAGEYLITESTNLYEAYYHCQWYDMSNSMKKQIIICMIGAKKPIQLTAGGIYIFSLVSFTGILKSSAGYISMLRTMT